MTEARAIFQQAVLPLFERTRESWLHEARTMAKYLAHKNGTVTINDVTKIVPIPKGIDPRVAGAVFGRKGWRRVGFVESDRKVCHGRPISVFQLAEAQ